MSRRKQRLSPGSLASVYAHGDGINDDLKIPGNSHPGLPELAFEFLVAGLVNEIHNIMTDQFNAGFTCAFQCPFREPINFPLPVHDKTDFFLALMFEQMVPALAHPPIGRGQFIIGILDLDIDLLYIFLDPLAICDFLLKRSVFYQRLVSSTPTDKSLVNYLTLRYHCVSRNGTYFQRLIYFLIVSYSYN